ncbi:Alpha/Beta hydrolase protein [Colletotrichum phormii]|uniref:Alpha/Beta hydrolase protein n=1 Tax=Colletotrichum phormii TaxID=359342 RepID=A0AAI9ZEK4_9PEZI|nr:Alpha/Beta hydrolase protein [Colletotrichum phormii]KAK1622798.1 Alpha/Beta hydrolase protein [Colletotrichum phormii]
MVGFITSVRRKAMVFLIRFLSGQLTAELDLDEITQLEVDSRDQDRKIRIHVYDHPLPDAKSGPRPVLINWHGSGFLVPALGSDAAFCSTVRKSTGMIVIDADYRKAPADPFPAATDDAFDILQWVCGFSAGGNIALVTSTASCQSQSLTAAIRGVLALYLVTDQHKPPEEKKAPSPIRPIQPFVANFIAECYIPVSIRKDDPRISPTFTDVDLFPQNMLFITCEGDNLCLEAEQLASKIHETGRNVISRRFDGVAHAWDKSVKAGTREEETRNEAYMIAVEFLRENIAV